MDGPAVPFDVATIRTQLDSAQQARLGGLTLLAVTDSTNRALARMPAAERHAHAVIADRQTAGRGRRGRRWHSPPGAGLHLSLGWRFDLPVSAVAPLSLACAVVAVRQLEAIGLQGAGLKWPNDLQAGGRKLGGVLLESWARGRACTEVVVGVGINVHMPRATATDLAIGQPWTDVASHIGGRPDPRLRDRLAGQITGGLLNGLVKFGEAGFEPFREDWDRLDVLRGRQVVVTFDNGEFRGTVLGLAASGALRVRAGAMHAGPRVREFLAAEVSVREP